MAKTVLGIFQIRKGVFALGRPGKRAKAVCTAKGIGVRGVKPTIAEDAKRAAASARVRERLNELAAN